MTCYNGYDGKRSLTKLDTQGSSLWNQIKESRGMLQLKENWDDEGAVPISKNTWVSCINYLINLDNYIRNKFNKQLDIPRILPEPTGAILINWQDPFYELLVKFPKNPNEDISYYGGNLAGNTIKGTLNSEVFEDFYKELMYLKNESLYNRIYWKNIKFFNDSIEDKCENFQIADIIKLPFKRMEVIYIIDNYSEFSKIRLFSER